MAAPATRPGHALARVLAAGLLLGGLAAPATAAADTAAAHTREAHTGADDIGDLGPPAPRRLSPHEARQLRQQLAAAPAPDPADATVASLPSAAGVSDTYDDFCDDATSPGEDLRRAAIASFPSDDAMRLEVETCGPIMGTDLLGGVSLVAETDEGRSYVVEIHQAVGQFVGSVFEVSDADPGGVVRHTGTAWLTSDGHAVAYDFPASALDTPDGFSFSIQARDAAFDVVDVMPELDELEVGQWPGSCQRRDLFRASVSALPGELPQALRSARSAGLRPTAVHGHASMFDVVLADAADAALLAGLPGIRTVAASAVFERPRPGAVPAVVTVDDTGIVASDAAAWWRTQVGAAAADGIATGDGTTIGVIDNGVDGTRIELRGRVAAGYDIVRSHALAPGANSDRGGHGTLVAGVAAAASAAVNGIAPGAMIRPYQVFDFAGCATSTSLAEAVDRGIDDRIDVLNLSLGSRGSTAGVPELAAALVRAQQAGIVVVAASGNEGLLDQPVIPADHAAVIGVGATGSLGQLAPYSNRAAWVELVAPGGAGNTPDTGILSLGERGGYDVVNGTSFAAPIVAGAAALYLEVSNGSGAEARAALTATAQDLGDPGRDVDFGFGLLDIEALLADAGPEPAPLSVRDITATCELAPSGGFPDVAATDTHAAGIDCVAHYAIAGGFAAGTYRPAEPVTRGQMATFIARTIEATGGSLPEATGGFADAAGTAHDRNISRLAEVEIVGGFPDGTYRPDGHVTRAQMAAFLVRALEYRTGVTLPETDGGFTDVAGSAHEIAVGKAAGAGLTGGDGSGRYRPADDVTRGQMGSFLARTVAYLVDTGSTAAR